MAIINLTLDISNATPVDGGYKFTTQFYNAVTGALSTDTKYPQNQEYFTTKMTNPFILPVQVADGVYTINNIKLKIQYKDKSIDYNLSPTSVNCVENCGNVFPITSVTKVTNTTYRVVMATSSSKNFAWKILNTSGVAVATGSVNVNDTEFDVSVPTLASGNYLFELVGSNCKGKDSKPFSVVNTLSPCEEGPTLLSIVSSTNTSVKFEFDGVAVFGIAWRIKQGSNVLRNGIIKHTSIAKAGDVTFDSSQPTVTFGSLPSANYTFEIEGNTCSSSVSSRSFSLSPVAPINFVSGSPSVRGTSGNYAIDIKLTSAGTYETIILNTTTGTYYQNGSVTYTSGGTYSKESLPVGTYYVKVGTMEATLKIEASSVANCGGPFTLLGINAPTQTSLSFDFHSGGNDMTALQWRIKKDGNVIRNGIVYPTNSSPTITFNEVPTGAYSLEVEGSNCKSNVGTSTFNIAAPVASGNAGTIETTVNGRKISYINGRDIQASVVSGTGAIRLDYKQTKKSFNNASDVNAFLFNQHMVPVSATTIAALRSTQGAMLDPDEYGFYLYYAKANTFDEVLANMGTLFSNPGTIPSNAHQMQQLWLDIKLV